MDRSCILTRPTRCRTRLREKHANCCAKGWNNLTNALPAFQPSNTGVSLAYCTMFGSQDIILRTPNSSRASSHPHIRHHTFIAKLEGEKSRTVIAVKRDWKNELNQSDIWSLMYTWADGQRRTIPNFQTDFIADNILQFERVRDNYIKLCMLSSLT